MIVLHDKFGSEYTVSDDLLLEIRFLRYFFGTAGNYMGPADMDIYDDIRRSFKDKYGSMPSAYDLIESEEDEK